MNLEIKRAIAHYRKETGKPMTMQILGSIVFKGENISPATTKNYLSQWNTGDRLRACTLRHLVRIHKATGISYNELINS